MESRSVALGSSQEQVVFPAATAFVHSAIRKLRFVPKFSRSVTTSTRSFQESETILAEAGSNSPDKAQGGKHCCRIRGGRSMSSESILGLEENNTQQVEQTPVPATVDVRLNTLRETVLELLDEVESLAISRPVDIKRGARFSDEVRQFEVSLIRTALGRTSGSQTRAARLLGLKPTTLNAKIKRYGITA